MDMIAWKVEWLNQHDAIEVLAARHGDVKPGEIVFLPQDCTYETVKRQHEWLMTLCIEMMASGNCFSATGIRTLHHPGTRNLHHPDTRNMHQFRHPQTVSVNCTQRTVSLSRFIWPMSLTIQRPQTEFFDENL
jgi:hypothetical protein